MSRTVLRYIRFSSNISTDFIPLLHS